MNSIPLTGELVDDAVWIIVRARCARGPHHSGWVVPIRHDSSSASRPVRFPLTMV